MARRKNIREKFHKLAEKERVTGNDTRLADWEPVMAIGTAAGMVNLSVSALRKYEREGLLIYHRTESGRRLLCRADIKRIKMIQHMINDLGLNIEGIRRLLALLPCWDLKLCSSEDKATCEAMKDETKPCWMTNNICVTEHRLNCRDCEVYRYGAYCAVTMKLLLHGKNG